MFEHEELFAQSNEHHERTVDNLVDELSVLLADAENVDIKKIDLCLDELDKLDPQNNTFQAKESLEFFHARYDSFFLPSPATKKRNRLFRPVRYITVAAVVLVLVGSLIAQAAGYDVWGRFFTWTKEQFQFSPPPITNSMESPKVAPGKASDFDSLQDALDACGVDTLVAPHLFPAGYYYESISLSSMSVYSKVSAHLSKGEETILVSFRIYSDSTQMNGVTTEKDESPIDEMEVNGIIHYIMNNNSKTVAVWINGTVYGTISGDISTNEMKEVIKSIYI